MSNESNETSGKHLSAEELLRNKGICFKACNDFDDSSRALPKTGAKLFEPNDSWLQKKQIEKGLESRKVLLGIERVERVSQLASAEWLPKQKKARVTKKSGQRWANYGSEVSGNLNLIPEEALILLETECLELTWDGVPLSIQQSYELLINSEGSDCTLEEYRVYSHLTRLGYRLQRFCYDKSILDIRVARSDDMQQRKKVLIDPENGLWMTSNNGESSQKSKNQDVSQVDSDVKKIVDPIDNAESSSSKEQGAPKESVDKTECIVNLDGTEEKLLERKVKNPRVEIVSEQTMISPIMIVKDGSTSEALASKWPGARIQRNVKLLPKRNDKLPASGNAEISSGPPLKRSRGSSNADDPESKKSKHEVIDLSDDEIEEIPRPMSRMEMLNCLPNIASQTVIMENISRKYLPRGIRPQGTYRCGRRLRKNNEDDRARGNSDSTRDEMRNGSHRHNNNNSDNMSQNAGLPFGRYSNNYRQNYPVNNYSRAPNRGSYFPHQSSQYSSAVMIPGAICMQQISIGPGGWQNSQSMITGNRWTSFQMNMSRNAAVMGYAMRSFDSQNPYQTNFQSFIPFTMEQQQFNRNCRYLERSWRGSFNSRSRASSMSPRFNTPRQNSRQFMSSPRNSEIDIYQASFAKLPGTSSWSELKQKWRDAKTITIDDEESVINDDNSDIQVVGQTVKPLIGNARTITDIYSKLRIIKSAPERSVRRKKSDFKISYNVYSNKENFKKSNPGLPMWHLVITSRSEDEVLQPVELNRLQQDAKGAPIMFAHVSNSSISYLQPGIVFLQNLI